MKKEKFRIYMVVLALYNSVNSYLGQLHLLVVEFVTLQVDHFDKVTVLAIHHHLLHLIVVVHPSSFSATLRGFLQIRQGTFDYLSDILNLMILGKFPRYSVPIYSLFGLPCPNIHLLNRSPMFVEGKKGEEQ